MKRINFPLYFLWWFVLILFSFNSLAYSVNPPANVHQYITNESGEIWQACVAPNDGIEDGWEKCSNIIFIN